MCNVCQSKNNVIKYEKYFFSGHGIKKTIFLDKCNDCGSKQLNRGSWINSNEIFNGNYSGNLENRFKEYCDRTSEYPSLLEKIISKDSSIIDFACSNGYLMHNIQKSGFKIIDGFDIDDKAVKFAQSKGLNASSDVPDHRYDLVLSLHLLNLYRDIDELMNTLTSLMSENGKLFVAVADSVTNFEYPNPLHYTYFTPEGLAIFAKRHKINDFKIIRRSINSSSFPSSELLLVSDGANIIGSMSEGVAAMKISNIRKYYEGSLTKEVVINLKKEYKRILSSGHKPKLFERLIWSKLFKLFSLRYFKK